MRFNLIEFAKCRSSARFAEQASCVYVIACPGYVKIGVGWDAEKRCRDLQVGCPLPLTVARVYRFKSKAAAMLAETAAHKAFADHYASGEWFALRPEDTDEVLQGAHRYADKLTTIRETWRRSVIAGTGIPA